MLVMAINRECSTAHFALIISVTFKYLHQPLPPISTSNITSLASPSFLTQKMYFTVNLIAALMLAISVQSRGRPGTDPNQAFTCTSTPQCTTGVCIAKTGPNTYAVKRANVDNYFSCANEPIGNRAVTGTLCCPGNFVGEDRPKITNGNDLFTACVAPDP